VAQRLGFALACHIKNTHGLTDAKFKRTKRYLSVFGAVVKKYGVVWGDVYPQFELPDCIETPTQCAEILHEAKKDKKGNVNKEAPILDIPDVPIPILSTPILPDPEPILGSSGPPRGFYRGQQKQ